MYFQTELTVFINGVTVLILAIRYSLAEREDHAHCPVGYLPQVSDFINDDWKPQENHITTAAEADSEKHLLHAAVDPHNNQMPMSHYCFPFDKTVYFTLCLCGCGCVCG